MRSFFGKIQNTRAPSVMYRRRGTENLTVLHRQHTFHVMLKAKWENYTRRWSTSNKKVSSASLLELLCFQLQKAGKQVKSEALESNSHLGDVKALNAPLPSSGGEPVWVIPLEQAGKLRWNLLPWHTEGSLVIDKLWFPNLSSCLLLPNSGVQRHQETLTKWQQAQLHLE